MLGLAMNINEDRALADLHKLATFGKVGRGVNRPALSDADIEARKWLRDRMNECGLEAAVDSVGTVYGRSPGAKAAILLGSHSDSVPMGGWLDGALGVIFALEVARAQQASHASAAVGVDVVSFSDEEGTFLPCMGSRAFCGLVSQEEMASACNPSGEVLLERLGALGLVHRGRAQFDPARHRSYLEAHIEQGPRLIEAGVDIGVVTTIVGLRRFRIRFEGQADHAGTTPMEMRRDAAAAMFSFAASVPERLHAVGSADSVWNLGVVTVKPGAANVVASEAELVVEFRDVSDAAIVRMEEALAALVAERNKVGGVSVAATAIGAVEPTAMDVRLVERLDAAAAAEGASRLRMPSGAGHDAMIVGRRAPAAMLFVPSIGGRSHDVAEDTAEEDIRRGLRVYARAVNSMLEALGPVGASAL
jgi:beta-ureidopropionase / N-carbamoyl-L-amino-acid hydrolase